MPTSSAGGDAVALIQAAWLEMGRRVFLVLLDDQCIQVYSSPEEAAADIEALDVGSSVRSAFDDTAQPYVVEWTRPNRRGKVLGILPWLWVENGEYRFVCAGTPNAAAFEEFLGSAALITSESTDQRVVEYVQELERLRASKKR